MAPLHCIAIYETAERNGNRLLKLEPSIRKGAEGSKPSCTIEIASLDKRQEIYGFGGGISESSAYLLSGLPEEKRRFVLDAYYRDSGYSLGRTPLNSSDFSPESWTVSARPGHFTTERSDRYLLPILKEASDISGHGLWLMVSPWSPPAYMKTNGSMYDGGKLKKECYAEWAGIFARYLAHLRDSGLNVWACSVQNECESVRPWETCLYTAEEETKGKVPLRIASLIFACNSVIYSNVMAPLLSRKLNDALSSRLFYAHFDSHRDISHFKSSCFCELFF